MYRTVPKRYRLASYLLRWIGNAFYDYEHITDQSVNNVESVVLENVIWYPQH